MTESDPRLPRLLSIADVADSLGVEVRHVRRLVHERRIPFVKWGHLLRFDPAELLVWIDAHRQREREGVRPEVPFVLRRRPVQAVPREDR